MNAASRFAAMPRPPGALTILIVVGALYFLGPFTVFGAALLLSLLPPLTEWRERLYAGGVSLVSLIYLAFIWPILTEAWTSNTRNVATTVVAVLTSQITIANAPVGFWDLVDGWFLTLPALPVVSLALWLSRQFQDVWQGGHTPASWLAMVEGEKSFARYRFRWPSKPPKRRAGELILGQRIGHENHDQIDGIVQRGQWIGVTEKLLDQHIFVLGSTGSGKSETLKRLIYETLSATERDVFVVDGKGDEGFAASIVQMARAVRGYKTPVVRMGHDRAGEVYHGFCGSPQALYSRLCALLGTTNTTGGTAYYADINRDLLQLICYSPPGQSDDPPRSFDQVRERLNKRWLRNRWQDVAAERELVRSLTDEQLEGLLTRIRPLSRELSPYVRPDGFTLDTTHCAVFSLRSQSAGDTITRFVQFLIEDIKDFVGKRQRRPGLLVIDEFGVFGNENIVGLLALARSARMGIVLSTQSLASLGKSDIREQILDNTRTKLLMASEQVKPLLERVGTKPTVQVGRHISDGLFDAKGTAHMREVFKIDDNDLAQLQEGEAYVVRQHIFRWIRIHRLGMQMG